MLSNKRLLPFLLSILSLTSFRVFASSSIKLDEQDQEFNITYDINKGRLRDENGNIIFAETDKLIPGLRTIKNFLKVAIAPIGSTMYIWGGGWDQKPFIGVSPNWKRFYNLQDSSYNFEDHRFPDKRTKDDELIFGFDCSGFVGWVIFNTMYSSPEDHDSFVCKAKTMSRVFSDYPNNFGRFNDCGEISDLHPGDIVSFECGHVVIVLGVCDDGSSVLIESTVPNYEYSDNISNTSPGVQLTGTLDRFGNKNSKAVDLASKYMKKYYPEWCEKFPSLSLRSEYFINNVAFSSMAWNIKGFYGDINSNDAIMSDPDDYLLKSAEEILKDLFDE